MKHKIHSFGVLLVCAGLLLSSCGTYRQAAGKRQAKGLHPHSASVFTASDRHESGNGNNLQAALQAVVGRADIVRPGVILLGGDYVGKGPDRGRHGQPPFSVEDIRSEIRGAMGDSGYDVLLTYGSHDRSCAEGLGAFFSGPYKGDGYYLYGISHAQMSMSADSLVRSYNGLDVDDPHGKSAESATRSFLSWVHGLDDHAPIILMSHVPMHANRGDNRGGSQWFDALNEAAKEHDIVLLFCHNHSLEERGNDTDQSYYLRVPGEEIEVQGAEKDEVVKGTLHFTYGNAGYLKLGWSTLITFTDVDGNGDYDKVEFHRYHIDGEDAGEYGRTGKPNPYTMELVF